jgi:exopolysaccharide biosynthesis polyprenyl glycosylphosphotransferase
MPTFRRRILFEGLKIFHLAIMVVAFALAAVLALGVGRVISVTDFLSMRTSVGNFIIFIGLLFLWHNLFAAVGLYESHRFASRMAEAREVVKATFLGTLILTAAALLFHIRMASLSFLLVFFLLSTGMLLCSRLGLKAVLTRTRLHGRNLRHVLIVGTNRRAIEFAQTLETRVELGYRIIGFADREWGGIEEFRQSGRAFVCELDSLPEFLRKNVVDEVAIALPIRSLHDDASRVAALCEKQGIILRLLPNIFDLKLARATAEELEGHPFITHYTGTIEGWPVVVKRALDFCLALVALLIVSPVMLLAAALIKIASPGPIFFAQKRIGRNKRKFTIYKFRTMAVDAENKMRQLEHLNEVSGPVFKIKDDPRITPVGRFLRKTSIDELPQLFNVLKGDMSLVGPRPLPIRDYEGFNEDWHRRRFSVRPGITCLWQVNGRSSIPFEKWMELDMQYIDKWSLWLDLKILAQTIPAVLKGLGAA